MTEPKHITLSELSDTIKEVLSRARLQNMWVVAEINNINVHHTSGHCYLELIERSKNGQTKASVKANIWANKYKIINHIFETKTGVSLKEGMLIMFCCTPLVHPLYGLSINIQDIDPTYTVGETQRQRNIIIATLKENGIFDMNKELVLPVVLQRIAIISSVNAAGYEDFIHQINSSKYNFYAELFPASMQGAETERSVCEALSLIMTREEDFDCVVIIRGGGATTDLQWFDAYNIAEYICNMPIPIITGIGHQRDLSIADMVAYDSMKTPTAVASMLIEINKVFDDNLTSIQNQINNISTSILSTNNRELSNLSTSISNAVTHLLINNHIKIESLASSIQSLSKSKLDLNNMYITSAEKRLKLAIEGFIEKQIKELSHYNELLTLHNPQKILDRGFAIIKHQGKYISSVDTLKNGDMIDIVLSNNKLTTKIINIE